MNKPIEEIIKKLSRENKWIITVAKRILCNADFSPGTVVVQGFFNKDGIFQPHIIKGIQQRYVVTHKHYGLTFARKVLLSNRLGNHYIILETQYASFVVDEEYINNIILDGENNIFSLIEKRKDAIKLMNKHNKDITIMKKGTIIDTLLDTLEVGNSIHYIEYDGTKQEIKFSFKNKLDNGILKYTFNTYIYFYSNEIAIRTYFSEPPMTLKEALERV